MVIVGLFVLGFETPNSKRRKFGGNFSVIKNGFPTTNIDM